jgi:hypothetical protein
MWTHDECDWVKEYYLFFCPAATGEYVTENNKKRKRICRLLGAHEWKKEIIEYVVLVIIPGRRSAHRAPGMAAVCTHDLGFVLILMRCARTITGAPGMAAVCILGRENCLGWAPDQSRIKPFAVEDGERAFRISEFCCMLIRSGRSNKICGFHWRENF